MTFASRTALPLAIAVLAIVLATIDAQRCQPAGPCTNNNQCSAPNSGMCACDEDRNHPQRNNFVCQMVTDFCGTRCVSDNDCPYPSTGSECNACINGKCSQPTCGSNCTIDEQCTGECTECGAWPIGKCIKPTPTNRTCGTKCTADNQCSGDGCNQCLNGICDQPPAPGCGKSCDGGCQYDECNYCGNGGSCTTYKAAVREAWIAAKATRDLQAKLKKNGGN